MPDMPDMSVHDEVYELVEKATAAAALNAVYVLSQWVYDQGHPELAERMRADFVVTTENPEQPADPER